MAGKNLKIALAQLNFTVGDIAGNIRKICTNYIRAVEERSDLIIFSELAISGYPTEDLLLSTYFKKELHNAICELAKHTINRNTAIIIGSIIEKGGELYNGAFLLKDGEIAEISIKHSLPNYGVFDECRIFSPGSSFGTIEFLGNKLGIIICEDIWSEAKIEDLISKQAELIICINASPFEKNKYKIQLTLNAIFPYNRSIF